MPAEDWEDGHWLDKDDAEWMDGPDDQSVNLDLWPDDDWWWGIGWG